MVLIGDTKYACEACIKGHRSSSCKHTDRPLFEIKKKGRPVTQCEHCRELRKTKQVHVKCVCESNSGDNTPSTSSTSRPKPKKGNLEKVLAAPAFPDGLPASLGAQVVHQPSSDGSSDSDQPDGCTCKDTNNCTCGHVKRSHKRAPTVSSVSSTPASTSSATPHAPALNRLGDLRPVLPRPGPVPPETSAAPFQHHHRAQHGSTFFNPYGRAYQEHALYPDDASSILPQQRDIFAQQPRSASNDPFISQPNPQLENTSLWGDALLPADLQILCGCGDSCSCPGCVQHRGQDAWTNGPCANPNGCNACLMCSLNNLPAPTPTPPTTPSIAQAPPSQFGSLDEWMRNTAAAGPTDPNLFYQQQSHPDLSSLSGFVPSLDNSMPPSTSFDPYAINVFDEGQTTGGNVRGMSLGLSSSSDGGFSMDSLGVSPITRRSSSFSGASPSPRDWMPPPGPPPGMSMSLDDGSSYQRPFFSNPKAASTTSLLPPDLLNTSSLHGRSSSSRSTTDSSAFRSDFASSLSEEMESLMSFAAGKFSFGEEFVEGFSGEGSGGDNEQQQSGNNNRTMEFGDDRVFDERTF